LIPKSIWWIALTVALLLLPWASVCAVERFPPPDFTSSGHVLPETTAPAAAARGSAWWDVAVLAGGLLLASWITLKLRSRPAVVVLSLVSLAYFGFWRRGCVCAIGSIQNVALGLADPGYAVPLAVIAFFALPLVTALVWGRGFCAGVCPHGALQDLVLVKPLTVPRWLDEALRVIPWIYLGLAVLLAATGSAFIICKYDPFVGIFRLAGPRAMLVAGAGLLLLSMFVGRPYCRYVCPYGALLGWLSRVAKWRPTVTPDTCTRCRLCETSCPFGALTHPRSGLPDQARILGGRRRVVLLFLTVPLAAILFGWLGGKVGLAVVPLHPAGQLAEWVVLQEAGRLNGPPPDELTAYRQHGADRRALFAQVAALESRSRHLGQVIGVLFGLILSLRIIRVFFPEDSADYATDRADCVSCARCFSACPYELVRRGLPVTIPPEGGGHA